MSYEDCISDGEFTREYHKQIRATNRRNPARFDCPDCEAKNALSAHQKQQGYHCSACTASLEGPSMDGGMFGDYQPLT